MGVCPRGHAGGPHAVTSERYHPSLVSSLPVSGGLALTCRPLGDELHAWCSVLCRVWGTACALRGPAACGVWSHLHPCVYPTPQE